jgi:hypothetical protein
MSSPQHSVVGSSSTLSSEVEVDLNVDDYGRHRFGLWLYHDAELDDRVCEEVYESESPSPVRR